MAKDTRAVLLGMKERLVQGWTQGQVRTETGVCLYGALVDASGIEPRRRLCLNPVAGRGTSGIAMTYRLDEDPAALEAARLLAVAAGTDTHALALWNDAEGRTEEEVVALVDKALELLGVAEEIEAEEVLVTV